MVFRRENWPYGGQFSLDEGKENLSETSCKNKRELVNCEIVVVGRHVLLGKHQRAKEKRGKEGGGGGGGGGGERERELRMER